MPRQPHAIRKRIALHVISAPEFRRLWQLKRSRAVQHDANHSEEAVSDKAQVKKGELRLVTPIAKFTIESVSWDQVDRDKPTFVMVLAGETKAKVELDRTDALRLSERLLQVLRESRPPTRSRFYHK